SRATPSGTRAIRKNLSSSTRARSSVLKTYTGGEHVCTEEVPHPNPNLGTFTAIRRMYASRGSYFVGERIPSQTASNSPCGKPAIVSSGRCCNDAELDIQGAP